MSKTCPLCRRPTWTGDADDMRGRCAAAGTPDRAPGTAALLDCRRIALQVAALVAPVVEAAKANLPTVGSVVEWQPLYAKGKMRGRVSRIVDGRIYLEAKAPRGGRQRPAEAWFDASEVHRLTVVEAGS